MVITGAAQGLGFAMAKRYAREGCNVVLGDLQEEGGLRARDELRGEGMECYFLQTDVRSKSDVRRLAETAAERYGSLDVMINNAGVAIIGPSEDVTEEEWDLSIDVMQKGVFFGCQEAARMMKPQGGGVILNISSINAEVYFPYRLSYCAAKAAVSAMTKVLALEWARFGIRVNGVAPGVTATRMVEKAMEEKHIDAERYLGRIPAGRFGKPDDIADACFFLSSPQAAYVTGEILTVDGGWSVNGFI